MTFDPNAFKSVAPKLTRYAKYLEAIRKKQQDTGNINFAVEGAITSIGKGAKAFVIYGEPQSGKTQMMIGLTAKLLDEGHRVIIVLLNDNVQLLRQNLSRFQSSQLDPTARDFKDVLAPEIDLSKGEWVIFCKKNAKDLEKLIAKVGKTSRPIIIDDEADYATPNAKVNKNTETKIHSLVRKLIGEGLYIGVTATPARLDLNATFENDVLHWVEFPPHPNYTGPAEFFPIDKVSYRYKLILLSDTHDTKKSIREALFRYLAATAYLNTRVHEEERNYSMLVHTSGAKVDHSYDYKAIQKAFYVLGGGPSKEYDQYVRELWEACQLRYPNLANDLTHWILERINRNHIVVMNSDGLSEDYEAATTPRALFTIAIGGNIVSRGVTFNDLISMFFTRDAKHKIQQDTYIQRARMFGVRGMYLEHFELTIPESLYEDWHRCFLFHQLALLETRARNMAPAWIEDARIVATQSASVAKAYVNADRGEMGYEVFDLNDTVKGVLSAGVSSFAKLDELHRCLGEKALPMFVVNFAKTQSANDTSKIAIHKLLVIGQGGGYQEEAKTLRRKKGFLGTNQLKDHAAAEHHFVLITNMEQKTARAIYKNTSVKIGFKRRIASSATASLF